MRHDLGIDAERINAYRSGRAVTRLVTYRERMPLGGHLRIAADAEANRLASWLV